MKIIQHRTLHEDIFNESSMNRIDLLAKGL